MGTFTPSLELDLDTDLPFEFAAGIYASLGEGVYVPNSVEIDCVTDLPFEFASGIYASPGGGVYIPQTVELRWEDFPIEFAVGQSSRPALGVFTPNSVEIGLDAIQYSPFDHTVELLLQGVAPSFLHLPPMTEIIYPVIPISEAQKVLTRMDSEEIRVTNKVAAPVPKEIDTIRFRIDTGALAAFLDDLDANRLIVFRLSTPGYTPFGTNSQDNYVRVLTRTRPQREDQGLTCTVDVTFRFVATFP